MDLVRIGEKVVDPNRIDRAVRRILEERRRGRSQREVADRLGLDRSFVSRLEKLGEVGKGKSLAVVGFPLRDVAALRKVASEEGVDFALLMTNEERWDFVRSRSGLELLNEVMQLIAEVRVCDVVILIGSDYRVRVMEALLDGEVVTVVVGSSPLTEDVDFDPERLRELIRTART